DVFAPFTVREWTTSPVAEFDDCVNWPSPVRSDPPITGRPPLVPPTLPVLVLSGGLDTLTTWTDGAIVAEQLGPSARWVKVENTIHATPLADPYARPSGAGRPVLPVGQAREHHPRARAGRPLRLPQRPGPPVRPPARAAALDGHVLR